HNTPRKLFSKKAVELMTEACGDAMVVAGSNTRVTESNRSTQFSINPDGTPIFDPEEGDFVDNYKIILRKGDPVVFNKNFWD
ncbi:hypothetical protein HKB23_11395, partial [Vibrio parahaemolyticus]|nr:hypothetical protein [Vibrio parahaemolyticus]